MERTKLCQMTGLWHARVPIKLVYIDFKVKCIVHDQKGLESWKQFPWRTHPP